MRHAALALAVLFSLGGTAVLAVDHPVGGDRLSLKDPAGKPDGRSVKFKASKDPAIDPTNGGDPTVLGATLEVTGANPGDGSSGILTLPAGLWTGLGKPAGSKGYKFRDPLRSAGIKTITLKSGKSGGTLSIAGGKSDWSYAITQPQGTIDVQLTVGGDVYCARFTTYDDNDAGKVRAKLASAPASCAPPAPAVCGNGVVENGEQCDDSNTNSGDGCSATCQVENGSGLCAGIPTASGTALDTELVQGGLTMPLFVTSPPLDTTRLFILEQNGLVRIVKNGSLLPTPFIDVTALSSCCGEQGLLGLAFAPDYATSGVFYLSYTNNSGDSEIRRYTVSSNPDVANPSGTLILSVDQPFDNHNGGNIAFGPDGYLYIGFGDGGSGGDPQGNGQNLNTLLGKMLRIDVNAPTYTVPPSNPFVGIAGLDEIWAYGLRNPWRWSFDRGTRDLYIADVGQGSIEEVDVQPASSDGGENYGWNVCEGNATYPPPSSPGSCPSTRGFTFPVLQYDHSQGCSITGGYVYRGCRMPDLRGTYFYSDICSGFIRTFKGVSGGVAQNQQDRTGAVGTGGGVSSFGEDARGELYIVDYGGGAAGQGKVVRIIPGS